MTTNVLAAGTAFSTIAPPPAPPEANRPLAVGTSRLPLIRALPGDEDAPDTLLGQYIPLHYHYQMLDQQARIGGFEEAIAQVVKPGMTVLELGAGTGVLSFFAARAGAARVYAVERLPHVATAARAFIAANGHADRVDVMEADAMAYLPPEPVDVVICEMLHSGMLREKQLTMIASFKERYLTRFGGPLPRFVPEAAVLAVQPVTTNYDFHGYRAPVPMFVDSTNAHRTSNLAPPAVYGLFTYADAYATTFEIDHAVVMERDGTLDSLRFITKNLLALLEDEGRSIDWDMHDFVVPLSTPVEVHAGDIVRLRFSYGAGDSVLALLESIDRA